MNIYLYFIEDVNLYVFDIFYNYIYILYMFVC